MGKVGFGRWRVAKGERRLEEEGEEGTRRDDAGGGGESPGTLPFPWVGGSGDGGDGAPGVDGIQGGRGGVGGQCDDGGGMPV